MANFNLVAGQSYTLASSISSTQTTILLSSFKIPVTNTNITMATMNTDIAYGTLAPGTTASEIISFTGVTQNSDGTATLTGVVRGLDKQFPYTAVAGFRQPHAGQTVFILSDAPQVFNKYLSTDNANTITGKFTFPAGGSADAPVSGTVYSAPTNNLEYTSKQYVDSVAVAGAPNASTTVKGVVELATQAEVDAKSTTGSTGALLVPTPDTQRSTLLSDGIVDTGAVNAFVITPSPAITAYATYQRFSFKALNTNTGSCTINVSGLGVKSIFKGDGTTVLVAGDIVGGQIVEIEYDGTNFQMLSPSAKTISYSATGAYPVADGSAITNLSNVFSKIYSNVTPVLTSTTSSTTVTLYSQSIPANSLVAGSILRAKVYGSGFTPNPGSAVINIKYGAITIYSVSVYSTGTANSYCVMVEMPVLTTTTANFWGSRWLTGSSTDLNQFNSVNQTIPAITSSQNFIIELVLTAGAGTNTHNYYSSYLEILK